MEGRRERHEAFSESNPYYGCGFWCAWTGLTAGGAAMGATMGDVGILDNGLKRILGIFQDHSVTDDNTWDNDKAMLTAAEKR